MFADLQQAFEVSCQWHREPTDSPGPERSKCKLTLRRSLAHCQERAFYDRHRHDHIETNDDDFYDHVRSGDTAFNDPKSKFNRRKQGDPGVKLDHLMRFFDPKLARKMDDTNEVGPRKD